MNLFSQFDRIRRVDRLIRMKATGSPKELAEKLGISEKTVYCIITDMKEVMQAPIQFCRKRNSYFYEDDCDLHLGFTRRKAP